MLKKNDPRPKKKKQKQKQNKTAHTNLPCLGTVCTGWKSPYQIHYWMCRCGWLKTKVFNSVMGHLKIA